MNSSKTRYSGRALIAIALMSCIAAEAAAPEPDGAQPAQEAPAEEPAKFDITEYRVLGNSVLDGRDIERAVYPHLGPGLDFESVEAARQSLERAYRDRGYGTVFVDIPEQSVDDGIVRLRVTEGRLDRIRVTGARYVSGRLVRAALPALQVGTVPDLPAVQAGLGVVNRGSADMQITPVLRAGRVPGTFDVELKVQDKLPLHGGVEINDRYTADTTQTRATVNLSYDRLWQRPHSFSLQYQTAPENRAEAEVIAATYVARNPQTGRAWALYAVDSNSDVATIGALSVLGKGRIYGARYITPIVQDSEFSFSASLGVDFKDFDEQVQIDAENSLVTPISYLNWSAVLTASVNRGPWSVTSSIGPRFGTRRVANGSKEFEQKREDAQPNYFYVAGDAEIRRALPKDAVLVLRAGAQYTPDPLPSNEQFSFGGASSVRGYLESAQLMDIGVFGSIELQSPPLFRGVAGIQTLRLLAFLDAAVGALQLPPASPLAPRAEGLLTQIDLSSVGAGLRLSAFDGLEFALDWAYPLVPDGRTQEGDDRVHFRVRYGF